MQMSNITSKLKALKLELSDDLLVHWFYYHFLYNLVNLSSVITCKRKKWTLNELISYFVQEEERLKQEKTESA